MFFYFAIKNNSLIIALYWSNKEMKYSELHKRLKKAGCQVIRQGSNHPI